MLNLIQNQRNTVYSFLTSFTSVAPYTLRMQNNIDSLVDESFILTLTPFGERVRYNITPTVILGTYSYDIKDVNGKIVELGLAEIE